MAADRDPRRGRRPGDRRRERRWTWRPSTAPRPTCWTRTTCGRAAATSRRPSPARTSTTPASRSSARPSSRSSTRRGSSSTSAPAASWPSRWRPGSRPSGWASTATTSRSSELSRALDAGVGRIILDSFHEIDRLTALAREAGKRPGVLVRVTVGVEAHTHEFIATAHEDQKFGFSLAGGAAFAGGDQGPRRGRARPARAALAHRLADLRHLRLRGGRPAGAGAAGADPRRARASSCAELDLGGGFGIAYTTQDDPSTPGDLAKRINKIVESASATPASLRMPRLSIEPGRAIVGPVGASPCTRSARSRTSTASGRT